MDKAKKQRSPRLPSQPIPSRNDLADMSQDERQDDMKLRDVWDRGLKYSYERHKEWRKQRKIDARHRPLEFCLRPHLALLLYTLGFSLIGRGLTHFTSEPPYTALLWNEDLMWPVAQLFGGWHAYSMSPQVESLINVIQSGLGALFLCLGAWALCAPRLLSQALRRSAPVAPESGRKLPKAHKGAGKSSVVRVAPTAKRPAPQPQGPEATQRLSDPPRGAKVGFWLCILASCLQLFYVLCLWWDDHLRWSTLMEQALQVVLPLGCALMLPYTPPRLEPSAERIVRIMVSMCFIGHGLYALDVAPVPASFLTMTLNLTPLTESGARVFLSYFGALDLIAALLIWLPISEFKKSALIYMIIWGGLTAAARPLGEPSATMLERLTIWGPELVWRLSHTLVPLWLWRREQLSCNIPLLRAIKTDRDQDQDRIRSRARERANSNYGRR